MPAATVAITATDPARQDYLIQELRCASLRARLAAAEIDTIGMLLRNNWITLDDAVNELHCAGALDYVEGHTE
jgi:hypothetical protein